jgi:Glycosyl hydrolase catalytic core
MTRLRARPRFPQALATLAIPIALAVGLLIAPSAVGKAQAPRAHAAASYLTGIGDEQDKMFTNPLWRQLHTKIVRYIAPYDAVVHPYSLDKAIIWIRAAEAQHEQVLVAFYHSEYTPTNMPSVAVYQRDVQKFVKRFPNVRQYQSWDEANRGYIPHMLASPSAVAAAKYYQALIRVCRGCTVIGLDVLDAQNIGPTLSYISEFKHEIGRLRTIMPKIWGLHNYSDINRLESWRTRDLTQALGGQVWLTETGGIVQFGGTFPNKHGSGLTRAAKVLKYMFAVAASQSQIKRLYIYDWTGGGSSTRFDAGLMNAHDQPRQGYIVVCRQLHAAKCNAKVAKS